MRVVERSELVGLVIACFQDILAELSITQPGRLDETTPLFGRGSALDSLGLVTMVVDLEGRLADQYGISVSIVDERAMSERHSPFRSVGALGDYLVVLLDEQRECAGTSGSAGHR
jgi:acyl carrier protein